ncbi:5-formyltetrahydrofolate cyclo-ligase [Paramagnetospirillum kuznetsovii]|uniref:5-formyltetrahydrofolate cyclo-ligase n=1 Tax=Paramagnetospirillum kuznetsovii TaxID=2053833 RepID=A0A364NYN9_9PROT|nr:5-formyltetrahydrofolate cyclo-ligase [Paramagnetospirillum kuznetsovii]RAU22189.1 5-formyltetrahydrofolate cyclo-ligase [Paramagnetospirillum kuznetsovii]
MTDSPKTTLDPKTRLRAAATAKRAEAARLLGPAAAEALAALALGIPAGAVVAGYWPLDTEIDPRPLMTSLAASGYELALPVVVGRDRPLAFRAWSPGDELEAGPHGTRHPPAGAAVLRPSVVLTPLLAFDAKGFRLGYGGGYYDRTLALLRSDGQVMAIGLAYSAQRVDAVPAEAWDQKLDKIATELGVIAVEQA